MREDKPGQYWLLDPEAGRHVITAGSSGDTCQGHVCAVQLLQFVDCADVTSGHQLLQSKHQIIFKIIWKYEENILNPN